MKAPKKPKLKKMPLAPKMGASAEAWKSYSKKLDVVKAENAKIMSEYEKKKKAYDSEIKSREAIKNKASKIKSSLSGF
jgi:tRNA U54 and U55 pseudouridine synthase Pus10